MAAYTNEALVTAADSADAWSTPSDPAPGGAAACFPGGLQTSAQIFSKARSAGVRATSKAVPRSGRTLPGGGSPRRLTFRLGNPGSTSKNTKAEGTMYSGSFLWIVARS